MMILGHGNAMMTERSKSKQTDRLNPELREYFEAHPDQNYARLADELHILIEMVFGKDHTGLSQEKKLHLKDLHDVINFYKLRSIGEYENMEETVAENKDRVLQVMETYRWVIDEVRSRYSVSQLKYVGYLLDYLEHVQRVMAHFFSTLEKE
jgi:hypothetical protein